MAEQCCLYVVAYVPPGCTGYQVDDWVAGPCEPGCPDVIVQGGPCDGLYLISATSDCVECGGAAAQQQTTVEEVRARAAKRDPGARKRTIGPGDLGRFRRVEAGSQ